jgi:hypothetical protein
MKPNRRLLEAWQNGVRLRDAWWTFAESPKKQLFLEMESEGLHLELERSLKQDLTDRLYAGEFYAIGVESEGGGGPVYIPEYYFLKTAEIDWDKGTVAALDKEFYHVAVEGKREPADQTLTGPALVDPRLTQTHLELEPEDETLPSEPVPSSESLNQGERQSRDEASPSEPAPSRKRPTGRPPLVPMVREVIRELVSNDAFAGLDKWEIERRIRRKARERFPTFFPKPDRPTKNTINKALRLVGWPAPPMK